MLDLIVSGIAGAPPVSTPDWAARGLSAGSIVLTIVLFLITQRGKAWHGRMGVLRSITDPLDELRAVIDAVRQDATNAYQLWTAPSSVALDTLQEALEAFPDRRLRADLERFVQQLKAARGNSPITTSPGQDPPPLKGRQSGALSDASNILVRIDARILLIKRKGSVN